MSEPTVILRKVARNEWSFSTPRITAEVDDRLEAGIDLMLAGESKPAQAIFRHLMAAYPEHLDAYHHLALSFDREGKTKNALYLWIEAVDLALKLFPDDFNYATQRLPWSLIGNRPFLRVLYGMGFALMKDGQTPGAIGILERLLDLNPEDDQGARAVLVRCYFDAMLPEDVLSLCRRYPKDGLEQLTYGKVLALFQKGELKRAGMALKLARQRHPLIAAELVKKQHRRPKGIDEERIRPGGMDQAFLYWKEHGKHWQETLGAVAWLEERLEAEG